MDFQEILHQQLLSNSLKNYCWFLGFVLFGLLFKQIISKYLSHFLFRVLNRNKSVDINCKGKILPIVIPSLSGMYQIGELQALSCIVAGRSALGISPDFIASHDDHLQVGFSNTRT